MEYPREGYKGELNAPRWCDQALCSYPPDNPLTLVDGSDSTQKTETTMSPKEKGGSNESLSTPTDEAAKDLKKLGYNQEMTRVC